MSFEEQIKIICHKFNFWFHDLRTDEITMGLPYNDIYVFFNKYSKNEYHLKLNNRKYEFSPSYKEVSTPIKTIEDIVKAMNFFEMQDVICFVKSLEE
ncbi:MAG: hypothetical protein MJZ26_09000 [Fibrobacter sp.]|nr:hypothetical protein [Fibrobacter sp.]